MFEILLWTVHKCEESFVFVSVEEYIFVNLVCSLGAHSLTEFYTAFANPLTKSYDAFCLTIHVIFHFPVVAGCVGCYRKSVG